MNAMNNGKGFFPLLPEGLGQRGLAQTKALHNPSNDWAGGQEEMGQQMVKKGNLQLGESERGSARIGPTGLSEQTRGRRRPNSRTQEKEKSLLHPSPAYLLLLSSFPTMNSRTYLPTSPALATYVVLYRAGTVVRSFYTENQGTLPTLGCSIVCSKVKEWYLASLLLHILTSSLLSPGIAKGTSTSTSIASSSHLSLIRIEGHSLLSAPYAAHPSLNLTSLFGNLNVRRAAISLIPRPAGKPMPSTVINPVPPSFSSLSTWSDGRANQDNNRADAHHELAANQSNRTSNVDVSEVETPGRCSLGPCISYTPWPCAFNRNTSQSTPIYCQHCSSGEGGQQNQQTGQAHLNVAAMDGRAGKEKEKVEAKRNAVPLPASPSSLVSIGKRNEQLFASLSLRLPSDCSTERVEEIQDIQDCCSYLLTSIPEGGLIIRPEAESYGGAPTPATDRGVDKGLARTHLRTTAQYLFRRSRESRRNKHLKKRHWLVSGAACITLHIYNILKPSVPAGSQISPAPLSPRYLYDMKNYVLQFSHVNGLEPAVIFFLLMSRARLSSLCPPSLSSLFFLSRLITTKPFLLIRRTNSRSSNSRKRASTRGLHSLFRLSVACFGYGDPAEAVHPPRLASLHNTFGGICPEPRVKIKYLLLGGVWVLLLSTLAAMATRTLCSRTAHGSNNVNGLSALRAYQGGNRALSTSHGRTNIHDPYPVRPLSQVSQLLRNHGERTFNYFIPPIKCSDEKNQCRDSESRLRLQPSSARQRILPARPVSAARLEHSPLRRWLLERYRQPSAIPTTGNQRFHTRTFALQMGYYLGLSQLNAMTARRKVCRSTDGRPRKLGTTLPGMSWFGGEAEPQIMYQTANGSRDSEREARGAMSSAMTTSQLPDSQYKYAGSLMRLNIGSNIRLLMVLCFFPNRFLGKAAPDTVAEVHNVDQSGGSGDWADRFLPVLRIYIHFSIG
ncbi:hypothetical protein CCUS01_07756 [Colletotrichum cuscutae]|uniref:Uncharacterized protein n=1 Tax=Colletotrichum cuscutae TaxID=1209917 RepID=A0AAI9XZN7_9PEZI|nr:hypothetical protein CCUS01_07756 [Colletotrichum cuscutae]